MARKILLADDSVTAQNMGRKILADAGYEVITVNNGSAALKKVAEVKPDVIVLDVYMPGYSGLEVCQRLKEANETARIPILLTVGKLEPFKPEESRRARADAFIVKPFEASELLSALTKLEDKIVPRPEASKPGRFARTIAAVEEGRYDKTAAADEDTGWRNRIIFPSKKKKPPEPEDVDDPAIYNALNKDLRTTVEHPAPHRAQPEHKQEAQPEEAHVDLAALAAAGLPKDVTPEEIAALAAAAAQIKGAGSGKSEPEGRAAEQQATESRLAETQAKEDRVMAPQGTESVPEPPVAVQPETAAAEAKGETRAEAKEDIRPEAKQEQAPPEVAQEAAAAPPTMEVAAEQKAGQAEEKADVAAEKPGDAEAETPSLASARPADAMPAIAAPEPMPYVAADRDSQHGLGHGSGNGSGAHIPAEEPVTIAAAGSEFAGAAARWVAVPVALLPEEAAISLEHEMQKTYAALAAAEMAHSVPQEAPAETHAGATASAPAELPMAEPPLPVPAAFTPEVAGAVSVTEAMKVPVSEATEDIPRVKEFEAVSPRFAEEQPAAPAEPEPVPAQAAEPVARPESEAPRSFETEALDTKAEKSPVAEIPEPQAASVPETPQTTALEQDQKQERDQEAERKPEETEPLAQSVAAPPAEFAASAEQREAPALASEVSAEPAAVQISTQIPEASAPAEPAAGGIDDMAKKEKEIAANTAAAWASWRRIRESGDTKAQPSSEPAAKEAEEPASAKEEAAMAVAAGAEKAPEGVSAGPEGESAEIASIVDSVLADLRPKIVEEISKKLGKKK